MCQEFKNLRRVWMNHVKMVPNIVGVLSGKKVAEGMKSRMNVRSL